MIAPLLLIAAAATAFPSAADQTALDEYVNKPDSNYKWELTNVTYSGPGFTGVVVNMTSQQWLTESDVGIRTIWWHYQAIIIPDKVQHTDKSFLYITGGENTGGIPKGDSEDILFCINVAIESGMACSVLFQIPNAPIYFTAEQPPKRRVEDAIIAYTWRHFVDHPDEPEWLLRLPMTKAAVRAFDTAEAYLKQAKGWDVTGHIVAGASKRGWTTWTTAAVDKRVVAQIPIVMDLLHMVPNMHQMWRAYGGWTFAFRDYYALNFTAEIDLPEMQKMADIIDPYSYLSRYTMPTMVIDSTGDEFFQLDDNWLWWDKLASVTDAHLVMIQNAEHSLATGILEVAQSVAAFASSVAAGKSRPTMTWQLNDQNITLQTSIEPRSVTMWHSDTLQTQRRDWRFVTGSVPCPSNITVDGGCFQPCLWHRQPATRIDATNYVASVDVPENGWRAWLMQVEFPSDSGVLPFVFTTQVNIVPKNYPFEDCSGAACRGTLL